MSAYDPKRTFIPEKFLISVDAASNFGILVQTMLYGTGSDS